ncbi:uncharacterized protein N7529_007885 [Penicillium soppii]|jgi:hypothetical protein|uniref:uncharacterized protein n=1 Tax=Penicillium soppii TaxID=69789 RepID=UPI002549463C|nr:uncharacterized protein N7529_007885 [Penicillium soppii]KAJ5860575.1 hypothetical protein N7529_007885 [Penicillium soppii]
MPSWGRPPGARLGRNNRGGPWDGSRVEEVDSEEDVYGREMVRSGRYTRQLEYGGRVARRRAEYEELTDENDSVDGGDFDLYDHEDSTVAYAVQLAMRDKEDQLVDTALERIRRAQMLGQKNVRLSKRELDALERKRQQGDAGSRRSKQNTSRPSSRRNGGGEQPAAYPSFAPDAHSWARSSVSSRPTSSSSARPRTPTTQSLRPQQSNSPLRPPYPPYTPERFAPNGRPQSMQQSPIYPRPLPDDPQWAPPYYNPMQMSPYGETTPHQPQLPSDLRVGPQNRMSFPSSPYAAYQSPTRRRTSQSSTQPPAQPQTRAPAAAASESEESSEEESESSEDEVQIVKASKVAERPTPVQRSKVSGGRGGTRKRTSR